MKYLLTGGGTGGHIYPALAMADELRRRNPEAQFLYVGMSNRPESWVVPGRGYEINFVRSRPFPRSASVVAMVRFWVALSLGILKALTILLRFRPNLIVGTGGYVSAPVMLAYAILGKVGLSRAQVFAYEPNVHPGLLNQLVGGLAHRVGVAFEPAGRWFDMKRVAVVGYPVRRELESLDRASAREELKIPPEKLVVLAFGGSSGSRAINEAIVDTLPVLATRNDVHVLHITGRHVDRDYDPVGDTGKLVAGLGLPNLDTLYRPEEYLNEIQKAYAAADLVVCRGGAGTLTEICVCGLPAIIIPLPGAADDHQSTNARQLEQQGVVRIQYQESEWVDGLVRSRLDGKALASKILELLDDPPLRGRMAAAARQVPLKNSIEVILQEIEGLLEGRRPTPLNLEFPQHSTGLPADPNSLLREVCRRVDAVGGAKNLCETERDYLNYQVDRLLASDDWYEIPLGRRNVGVKLVGHLQNRARLPLLLAILKDRRKVGLWQRLFGGDFVHGGILRRNVIEQGIVGLGAPNDASSRAAVREALLESLKSDPYFEVRASAAQALGQLFGPDDGVEAALVNSLTDRACRVVIQAIRSLGTIAKNPEIERQLQKFYLHSNWQYRQEVVDAFRRLLERGVLDPDQVATDLDQILATSPYFVPEFPLKESLMLLAQEANRGHSANGEHSSDTGGDRSAIRLAGGGKQ